MAAVDLTIMTPIKINSTVLAVESISHNMGINLSPFRHSGLPFESQLVVDTISPTVTFRAPFEDAWALMGANLLKATTLEIYNRTFTNFEADAGGVKYVLAASASAICYIQTVSEGNGGVMMADCVALLLSADGTTHPLAAQASAVSIPAVAAEPQLQVRGPLVVNGTRISGVTSVSLDLGQRVIGQTVDGDTYPRTYVYDGGLRTLSIGHSSSKAAIAAIGLFGSDITADVVAYFRDVNASTGLTTGTAGASVTIADGRVEVTDAPQSVGSTDGCTIRVTAIDADGDETDPIAVSFAATMPAA